MQGPSRVASLEAALVPYSDERWRGERLDQPDQDASIGVAALPLHAQARESLIRAADRAAYAAKQAGKGRVCRPEDAAVALDQDPAVLAQRLEYANMATVEALAAAVDAKDPYTRGHSHRVSAYATALAEALKLSPADVARVRLAGLLHDVGKIGVPDAILTKAGTLSEAEFAIIRQHSVIGERMLSQVPLRPWRSARPAWCRCARCHLQAVGTWAR